MKNSTLLVVCFFLGFSSLFAQTASSLEPMLLPFDGFEGTGIDARWHDSFCYDTEIPLVGDFNGDGKDDIATFTRGTTADVYVAISDGTKFNGTGDLWNGNICKGIEIPLTGDFNGDGKDDIATFTRGTTANVFVYISTGQKFNSPNVVVTANPIAAVLTPWLSSFCYGTQTPLVGDFNGDGKDDIATFTRATTADVLVALSDGTKFNATGAKWHDSFCYGTEVPLVGDFNGDKKDDIATFTRGTTADVYVALSDGTKFNGTGIKWHDSFCYDTEIPLVGDFNGDKKDDIATFTRGTTADVYVARSSGYSFEKKALMAHDNFCYNSEIPLVGNFNDSYLRLTDIATFTRGTTADVYVALAKGLMGF
ncbi:MAG: VCBS repeat-containing protein [Sphingobacteriales bacterium]|nr:VCBS repeat-containing protein [Sphingobacteriales bacterium]